MTQMAFQPSLRHRCRALCGREEVMRLCARIDYTP